MRVYVKKFRFADTVVGTSLSSRFCGSSISLPCRSGSDFSLWCGSGSDFSITVDADPNVTFHADPDSRQSDATEPSRCNSNSSQLLALHFGADPVHQNDADTCKSGSTTRLSIGSNMFWNCRFFCPEKAKTEPYQDFGSNGTSIYILKPTDLLPHLGQVLIMASITMFSSFVLTAASLKGQWIEIVFWPQ